MAGEMFVDMKMNITTCGAHSGLIVHSGVHQGKTNSSSIIWPYSNGTQSTTPPWSSIQFNASDQKFLPLSEQQQQLHQQHHQQQQQQQPQNRPQKSLQWSNESTSPPSTAFCSFHHTDSSPSEFIEPSSVQLNTFQMDPSTYMQPEVQKRESSNEVRMEQRPNLLSSDAQTTTTTVEVFRAKMDPNSADEYVTLPPIPAPGLNSQPQVLRAVGPDYEKWTTSRTETLINDPIKWENMDGSRNVSDATHHVESSTSIALNDNHYHSTQLAGSSFQPTTEKCRLYASRNEQSSAKATTPHNYKHRRSPYYAKSGSRPKCRNESEEGNFYEVARSRSVEDLRKPMLQMASHSTTSRGGGAHVSFYDEPTRRSELPTRERRSAPSEEIFHLYETRDAFGNIRAQCRTGMEEQRKIRPTTADLINEFNMSQNLISNDDSINDGSHINKSTTQYPDWTGPISCDQSDQLPYYSVQKAIASKSASIHDSNCRPPHTMFKSDMNSSTSTRNLWARNELSEIYVDDERDSISSIIQPSYKYETNQSLSRVAEIRLNSPNTDRLYNSENKNFNADNTFLKYSATKWNDSVPAQQLSHDERQSSAVVHEPDMLLLSKYSLNGVDFRSENFQNNNQNMIELSQTSSEDNGEYVELKAPSTYNQFFNPEPECDNFAINDILKTSEECCFLKEMDRLNIAECTLDRVLSPQSSYTVSRHEDDSVNNSLTLSEYNLPDGPSQLNEVASETTKSDNSNSQKDAQNSSFDTIYFQNCDGDENSVLIVETDLGYFRLLGSSDMLDNESKHVSVTNDTVQHSKQPCMEHLSRDLQKSNKTEVMGTISTAIAEMKLVKENNTDETPEKSALVSVLDENFESGDIQKSTHNPIEPGDALPHKSILHVPHKPSRRKKHKSVSFSSQYPKVIVDGHRLIVTDVTLDSDTA